MRAHPWLVVAAVASTVALVRSTSDVSDVVHGPPMPMGGGPPALDETVLDATRATDAFESRWAEEATVHATCANHSVASERAAHTPSASNH